ncbi:S41 family peptidase [Oscillatoria amoena NRMC-F 0135]|nr:S41 family peptidase [Oscillatoria amoena NRMC-F 0135]
MKRVSTFFRNRRKTIMIGLAVVGLGFAAFKSADDYFEISKNIDIYTTLYKEVNTYYVDEVEPSKLMREGIDAMLNSLDPYTNFISESEIEDYRFQITGQYGGIGSMIVKKGDYVAISEPYEGYAAAKSDLRAGDILLEADGKSLKGLNVDGVSKFLKGQPETEVTLKIMRDGVEMTKVIKREEIKVKNVPYYGMINEHTGYIVLEEFRNDAGKEVADALKELKKNTGLNSVILDLRGNPGGLLHEAVNIVNVFIDRNQLVVSTKGKVTEQNRDYRTINVPVDMEIPLVVLTNKGSASASEIVSGTIQDLDRGVVLGQRTYGKGLVQSTRMLSYGTQLKITTQKYYTPSGRCIQALDYSQRKEDGTVPNTPDSLRKEFKTKNGRRVLDGAGIDPDVKTTRTEYSKITNSLISKLLVFDFANKYRNTHDKIASAKDFKLTEADWKDFTNFLKDKEYDYQTETEKALEELKKKAEGEKYYEGISKSYEQLKKELGHDKMADLEKNKAEIMKLLEKEIATRYYYQRATWEVGFNDDPEITEALALLNDMPRYKKILAGR